MVMNLPSSRSELSRMFSGQGIELGVADGSFSSVILLNPKVTRLWSIDRWSDHHDIRECKRASERLVKEGEGRCIPLRATFDEALPLFEDGSLSFIFIDGYAHTGQQGGKTLSDWWPKLATGGIFSGHDYHERWTPTVLAVDKFIAEHGLSLNVCGTEKDTYPSWWVMKGGHLP